MNLLTFIAAHDDDLLSMFLAHYRQMGITKFRFCLHGAWRADAIHWLNQQSDCVIEHQASEQFSDTLKCDWHDEIARSCVGQWILTVDADEFLELPLSTLSRTIKCLEIMGAGSLPCWFVQRHCANGSLPKVQVGDDLDRLFPQMQYSLTEAMGLGLPAWKSKFSLVFVTKDFATTPGFHTPPNNMPSAILPISGVVNHFKWRDRLRDSLSGHRPDDVQHEIKAYQTWFETNCWTLPITDAVPYSRSALLQMGLLVRPRRRQRLFFSRLRKLRCANDSSTRLRIASQLSCIHAPDFLDNAHCKNEMIAGLAAPPGKIGIVSYELNGPNPAGGLGSAVAELALLLACAGHEVHIIECPFKDHNNPHVQSYWSACNVNWHFFSRSRISKAKHQWRTLRLVNIHLADYLSQFDFDVLHFNDGDAMGCAVVDERASGGRFQRTSVLTTFHGSAVWHYMDSPPDWQGDVSIHSLVHLSDKLCFPSQYMQEWVVRHFGDIDSSKQVVIKNVLRSSKRVGLTDFKKSSTIDSVNEIVFFGRIELRKGIDTFLGAIANLRNMSLPKFTVTILGSPDNRFNLNQFLEESEFPDLQLKMIDNLNSQEAINYLKTQSCVAVVVSIRDNLPYTVYETVANSIPLITTNIGGIPELIDSADHHRLINTGDTIALTDLLAEALVTGIKPLRLAFDPFTCDLSQLALHGNLVSRARLPSVSTQETRSPPVHVQIYNDTDLPQFDSPTERGNEPELIDSRCLYLHHQTKLIDSNKVDRLNQLMEATQADAVVCSTYIVPPKRNFNMSKPWLLDAPAGPAELSGSRCIYGVGCTLIHQSAAAYLEDFDPVGVPAIWWQWAVLNHIHARGGRIASVPQPLTRFTLQRSDQQHLKLNSHFRYLLASAWDRADSGDINDEQIPIWMPWIQPTFFDRLYAGVRRFTIPRLFYRFAKRLISR